MSTATRTPVLVQRYDGVAQVFHWLILALLIAQFAIAWTMPDITKTTPNVGLVAWHLSVGSTILLVMLLRLAWRLTHTPPPAPPDLVPALQLFSRLTHWLLYAILVVLPVLGWINASSRGYRVRVLGLIPLPQLVPTGDAFGHEMGDVHGTVAWVLLGVIALHVTGALFHLLVKRDGVMRRMLPG
jgi:cytochrome b561